MADISERIEKQMEGTNLALAAVAEVLQKMDGRLAKEEQDAIAEAEANANAAARADLVKSIANEVLSNLKKEGSEQGLDVDGKERKAKASGGTPQNADDSENAVTPTTKIEEQQNTIQASVLKADEDDEKEDIDKGHNGHDDDDTEKGGMAYKDDEADEEAADDPIEEKGMDEDDDESDEMKSMKKQIAALEKALSGTKADMQKAVTAEAESRLRKMGFREETGLQAPKLTKGLGVDDTPVIQKSQGADTAEQLASLSYSELRRMQTQIEAGNTDGIPRELLG
tara:strand:+ start:25512 stop:26360 length:849 start_codon:yes stop_codon:yes gene_type:complete